MTNEQLIEAGEWHAEGLTAQLSRGDWTPRRAHIEQARNSITKLVAALRSVPAQQEPADIVEDCAKIAEGHVGMWSKTGEHDRNRGYDEACRDIAKAIRDAMA